MRSGQRLSDVGDPTIHEVLAEFHANGATRCVRRGRIVTWRKMAPDAFERLAQRMLREADFEHVEVTGRAGDGGIDGKALFE